MIDKRVAPEELIVGIKGDLCYVTYKQGKKLNSETSWTSWSTNSKDPLIVTNKFSKGFKIAGVNGRWYSNASNSENLLITHPLFNKNFELPLSRFTELAQKITIIKGVIQEELIMDTHRNILLKEEYEEGIVLENKKAKEAAKLSAKAKTHKVKASEQVPGRFYTDYKADKAYLYLGTATIDEELKHVYYSVGSTELGSSHEDKEISIWTDDSWRREEKYKEIITHPIITSVYSGVTPTYELSKYRYSITKSKKSLGKPKRKELESVNIFDEYTDKDWELINRVYKYNSEHVDHYRRRSYNTNWSKADNGHEIHFREDYLKNENNI